MSKPKQHLVVGLQDNFNNPRQRSLSPIGMMPRKQSIEMQNFSRTAKKNAEDASSFSDSTLSMDSPAIDDNKRKKSNTSSLDYRSEEEVSDVESRHSRGAVSSKSSRASKRSHSRNSSRAQASSTSSSTEPRAGMSAANSIVDYGPMSDFNDDDLDLGRLSERSDYDDFSGEDTTDLEYFCLDHMKLCSSACIMRKHKDCANIVPAAEWVEKQRLDKDRLLIEKLLLKYDSFAGIMINEREDLIKHLDVQKEEVTDDFLDMIEDVITHVLYLQKDFNTRFDELHESKMKVISDQIKRCKMVQRETSSSIKELSTLDSGTEEYDNLKSAVVQKGPVYEEILRRDFQASTRIDYRFVPDPNALSLMAEMKSLGDISIHPKPSKLPGFLSVSKEVDYAKRMLKDIQKHDAKHIDDKNNCCISSCTFISNGRIVVADWNNACLKLFTKSCVLKQRFELTHNPWDVKPIANDRLIVTVPSSRSILTIGCKDELEIISSFETQEECYGIAVIGGNYAVTCDPWSKMPSVRVLTPEGKQVAYIMKNSNGEAMFRDPQHIATDQEQTVLYVSDTRLHEVIAVTTEGAVVFRYSHERLEAPTGITTDDQGHIYVCGKESKNIHQISKDGMFIKILLREQDELISPRGICFEPEGERIIVTDLGTPTNNEFLTARMK